MRHKYIQMFMLICLITLLFLPNDLSAQSLDTQYRSTNGKNDSGLLANWEVRVDFPKNELQAVWTGYVAKYQGNTILNILTTHEIDITQDCDMNSTLLIQDEIAHFEGEQFITCKLPDYKSILTELFAQFNSSHNLEYGFSSGQTKCECNFTEPPWAAAHAAVALEEGTYPLLSIMGDTVSNKKVAYGVITDFQMDVNPSKQTGHSTFDFIDWSGVGESANIDLDPQTTVLTKLWSGYQPNHFLTASNLLGGPNFLNDTNFVYDVQSITSEQFIAWAEDTPMVVETVTYDSSAWEASTMTEVVIGHKLETENYFTGEIKEIRFDPGCRGW